MVGTIQYPRSHGRYLTWWSGLYGHVLCGPVPHLQLACVWPEVVRRVLSRHSGLGGAWWGCERRGGDVSGVVGLCGLCGLCGL